MDIDQFRARVISSSSYTNPADTANSFADQLKRDILSILDELLPEHVITRRVGKSTSSCLSDEAVKAKQERRRLERKWKSTGFEAVRIAYRHACKVANRLINESRSAFYTRRVQETNKDPRMLLRTVNNILHTSRSRCSQEGLCKAFALHVKEKIDRVKFSVANSIGMNTSLLHDSRSTEHKLDLLTEVYTEEVIRTIKHLPNKTSHWIIFIHQF